jgi:hypothetical protein
MGNLVKSQAKEILSLLSLKDELHEIYIGTYKTSKRRLNNTP